MDNTGLFYQLPLSLKIISMILVIFLAYRQQKQYKREFSKTRLKVVRPVKKVRSRKVS